MPRPFTLSVSKFRIIVRSRVLAVVALGLAFALVGASRPVHASAEQPTGEARQTPRITIAVLPSWTEVHHLSAIDGLALGVMGAGLGYVVPDQTYLDISQGARVFNSLYDKQLPLAFPRGNQVPNWRAIMDRAQSAPDPITPGLLATTLNLQLRLKDGAAVESEPELRLPALMGATVRGRVARSTDTCGARRCRPPVLIRNALPRELRILRAKLRSGDLLIALSRPTGERALLPIAIAGTGFEGTLTSPTTRTDGYVISTDLAPTILRRFGMEAPDGMTGRAIESTVDGRSADQVAALVQRLEAVPERREPVLGVSVLIWLALSLAAIAHPRLRLHGIRILALTAFYMPLMLLVGAAVSPSVGVERLIVAAGSPALAVVTWLAFRGWRAMGIACMVTVLAHGVDLVMGSPLISLSLLGPNPGLGVRFYGIGNELGATLAMLTLLGTGALLAGFGLRRRPSAAVLVAVPLVVAAVFAAGRFGADVGSAIVLPASGVVAAGLTLGRPLLALAALAVPVVAVAALAVVDLVTGGGSHFQRSVLESSGSGEFLDTVARRLHLAGRSFVKGISGPFLPLTVIIASLGFAYRSTVRGWIEAAPPQVGAAFAAGIFASVLGTIANDSGALLLEVGVAFLLLATGYAWCESQEET